MPHHHMTRYTDPDSFRILVNDANNKGRTPHNSKSYPAMSDRSIRPRFVG